MYVIYSGLLALALLLGSPWFLYQGLRRRKYFGSLRQRLGALPGFVQSRRRAVHLGPCRLGGRGAGRTSAGRRPARTVSGVPPVRLDDHRRGPAAGPAPAAAGRRRLLLPDRLCLGRPPRARSREAAPAGAARRGDLAARPARVPAPRRSHGDRQRPRLRPVVSALPAARRR